MRKGEDGLPKSVGFISRGFRDVYWCHSMNEPVILTYKRPDEIAWCTLCDSSIEEHEFICTILKPRHDV